MRLIALLLLVAGPAMADSYTSTRSTAYDWACMDGEAVLSSHQRQDKAFEACANRALADGREYAVQGGRYRVTAIRDTTPEPPVVDPPPPTTGTASLYWTQPTVYTNGTPITSPVSCRLEYGRGDWSQAVPGLTGTQHVVNALGTGTWQFRMACEAGGGYGEYSNVVSKVVL